MPKLSIITHPKYLSDIGIVFKPQVFSWNIFTPPPSILIFVYQNEV